MVRVLFVSRGATWQAISGSFEIENELVSSSCHGGGGGTAGSRIRRRVELMKRVQRWRSLQITVPSYGLSLEFKLAASWPNGDLLMGYPRKCRRRSKVEPLVVFCVGEGGDSGESGDKAEELGTQVDEKVESIVSASGEAGVVGSEGFLDVKEKIEVLKDLELQPSVSRRGWLAQLKMAFGSLIGFLPLIPVQEEYMEVPTEQNGPTLLWEGWGTSLCWWANFVGGLPDVDTDYVIDLIFDQSKGLGFNIARYNIGGGADLKFDTNMRPFADVPGFRASADKGYDWSADKRQRKVLLGAKERGANLFEAFSNSPPGWMTYSGSVTGNWNKGHDNLKPEHFTTFADYLTEVVQRYEKHWGIHFDYLAPYNEPVEGFWNLDRKKAAQEGCNFSVSSINKLIPLVKKSLSRKGLSTQITAADAWSLNTPKVLRGLGKETLDVVSQINVHTYVPFVQREGDAKRSEVKRTVSGLGKKLWMSEYGPLNWGGSELDVALAVGRHITLDVNELQASAWCYWQVLEVPGKNFYWGLLHAEFKYMWHRSDPFRVQIKKQYYMMMHFSRWIRPGFTIFCISEGQFRDWLVLAVDPSKSTVVMVFTNTSNRNIDISFDVSGVAPTLKDSPIQGALIRTSETENHMELPTMSFKTPVVLVRIIAKSINTIVVSKANGNEK
ncbi:unnamed protein product [Calypogeia fissa]